MTLGDGKRKVLMLLDEYSSGGELTADEDIGKKMNDFFDMAQKEIASYKKIIRKADIVPDGKGGYHALPENFAGIFRIWKNGRLTQKYPVIDKALVLPAGDTTPLTLEYFVVPETINSETKDDYKFEVDEDAANCLPFFVAAQHLLPDLVVDYSAFWNTYLTMRAALDITLPTSGGGGVRQSLYRR